MSQKSTRVAAITAAGTAAILLLIGSALQPSERASMTLGSRAAGALVAVVDYVRAATDAGMDPDTVTESDQQEHELADIPTAYKKELQGGGTP